jgi:hypothetical protein
MMKQCPLCCGWGFGKHFSLVAAALPMMLLLLMVSCSRAEQEVSTTSSRTEPEIPTAPAAVGDEVRLPGGLAGAVGLWLMNPGTCAKDVTYQHVPGGSTAVIKDLCMASEGSIFSTRQRWYAKLAFSGQKLSQGTDNMWLPLDELTPVSKAKPEL